MIRNTIQILSLALALLAAPLCAQEGADHVDQGQHAERSTMDMEASEFFLGPFSHLEPHALGAGHGPHDGSPSPFAFYDVNLWQLIALGLMLLVFVPVVRSFDKPQSSRVVRVFRGFVHWIRDEVIYKTMGEEEGRRFAPFFIFVFFFILFMNVIGLVPHTKTATATTMVTGALASITFLTMVAGGMIVQGPVNYVKHLLPSGLPGWLIPLMAFVELIGLFVKPFALMIRLFANMLAGHLLIYSFVGMIFVAAKLLEMSPFTWLAAIGAVGGAVFINIIEALVVVLQAYIFVFLSVMFVQDSLHPAH